MSQFGLAAALAASIINDWPSATQENVTSNNMPFVNIPIIVAAAADEDDLFMIDDNDDTGAFDLSTAAEIDADDLLNNLNPPILNLVNVVGSTKNTYNIN